MERGNLGAIYILQLFNVVCPVDIKVHKAISNKNFRKGVRRFKNKLHKYSVDS